MARRRLLRRWMLALFAIAVMSLVVDQNTGDTTPPFDDSLLNQAAFFAFFGATILLLGLGVLTLVRWIRSRLAGPT